MLEAACCVARSRPLPLFFSEKGLPRVIPYFEGVVLVVFHEPVNVVQWTTFTGSWNTIWVVSYCQSVSVASVTATTLPNAVLTVFVSLSNHSSYKKSTGQQERKREHRRDPKVVRGHGLFQLQLSEQGSANIRISAHKFVSTAFLMFFAYELGPAHYCGSYEQAPTRHLIKQ